MALEEIGALVPPVADDAHLYLWTTNAFIEAAHDIARTWGFRPITLLTWMKRQHDPCEECGGPGVSMRSGYYFRGATEHCLFATRGKAMRETRDPLPTGFFWKRLPHSVKPEAFYDLVEKMSPGPYLEMFARRNRLGWHTWGNQVIEHVVMGENKVVEV